MIKRVLVAGALAAGCATPALAQSDTTLFNRDRNISVRERPHPEYDALGLREGGFLLFPKLEASIDYDDNIYASNADRESDGILTVEGSLLAKSQWSRHSLNMLARVTRDEFLSHGSESNVTATLEADGRYDIMRNVFVTAQGEYDRAVEPRSAEATVQNSVDPIQYNHGLFDLKGVYAINRFQVVGDLNVVGFDYENGRDINGAVVDQTYRDHNETRFRTELDYALSPATAVYGTVTGINFSYADSAANRVINRDSSGFEMAVGVDFEAGALIRAKVEVGYRYEDFAYAAASTVSGINYHGQLQYFPTQLTTLTFTADRKIQDSGIVTAPAYLTNEFTAQVDHELFRNVLLTGRLEYGHYSLIGIDREDDRGGVTFGATYLLNHGVGLNASYSFFEQSSSGLNRDRNFSVNQFRVGVVFQY